MHCLLIVLLVLLILTPGAISRLLGCLFWGVVIVLVLGALLGSH